ncbi:MULTISPECIES: GGDEF domain-containing protein [unclassified Cyanobium]|uniref:GGDEF domain-containing protein n=1 Tax=unclassified Cyanobium TaxID=2627006 RepID=UPI0037BEA33A
MGFEKRLELALAQAKRHGWGLAVFSIDVDEFKTSNDAHGHDAGDEVLQMVAARLALVVREEDMVSRWGEGMNSSAFWWKLEVLKMLRM